MCLETGWAWWELQATPAWVVRDVKTYLAKRAQVSKRRQRMQEAKSRHAS